MDIKMKNKYLKLTEEQKERNVVFSSQLISSEMIFTPIEVFEGEFCALETMERLKKSKLFAPVAHTNILRS